MSQEGGVATTLTMNRRNALNISAVAALGLALSLSNAVAQQKQHVSYKSPPESVKAQPWLCPRLIVTNQLLRPTAIC
jgi:hypothetical protein